ncbi:peptide-methionine (S)-S-oxide reductase MsrA [Noviherbaspirillum aerium]|uniref:peptide-methionine (S)-S-oxide reductase MsrA n=1 Tax=Noviherbaspirillum aerium TaxID=2588497 RepID=UPI001CEF8F08|nr:peptide-methionine (S)-S-oxide reductase MsrA [Noviherbaspirillum aerium]
MFKKFLSGIGAFKQRMPQAQDALPGRVTPLPLHDVHFVLGRQMSGNFPEGSLSVYFGMGCFWGVERLFWSEPGVFTTAVGYAGGFTPNPTYREVCSGQTGHAEVALVVYDPAICSFEKLLNVFWENHDPTQGMRQGNDMGTQYRSAVYCTTPGQYEAAAASMARFQTQLSQAGLGAITTQLCHPAPPFYYAEDEHQQYLAKNPGGYCGLKGTGVSCPAPLELPSAAR